VALKPLPTKHTGQPFKDISRSIFKNYINEIYKIGIMTGYTPTTFRPENEMIRGEMATFLSRFYNKFNKQSQSVNKTSFKVKDSTLYVGGS
jgi:hypothetical protein